MDFLSFELLQGFLPPPLAAFLHDHVLDPHAPFQVVKRNLFALIYWACNAMSPAFDRVTQALFNSPDLVIIVAVVMLLLVMYQILIWIRNLVMWWTRMMIRLVFWGLVAALIAFVYQRGVEDSARDAAAMSGKLLGWGAATMEFFAAEWRRYDAQAQQAQAARNGQLTGRRW